MTNNTSFQYVASRSSLALARNEKSGRLVFGQSASGIAVEIRLYSDCKEAPHLARSSSFYLEKGKSIMLQDKISRIDRSLYRNYHLFAYCTSTQLSNIIHKQKRRIIARNNGTIHRKRDRSKSKRFSSDVVDGVRRIAG